MRTRSSKVEIKCKTITCKMDSTNMLVIMTLQCKNQWANVNSHISGGDMVTLVRVTQSQ